MVDKLARSVRRCRPVYLYICDLHRNNHQVLINMGLETKHINLLRSCSNWLRGRSNTVVARNLGWSSLMLEYAKDLDEIADHLEAMGLPETVVTLDDLFKGKKK